MKMFRKESLSNGTVYYFFSAVLFEKKCYEDYLVISIFGTEVYIKNGKLIKNKPLKLFHACAFTYGNAGDNALVVTLKKTIEQMSNKKIIWDNEFLHNIVDDKMLKRINSSKALLIGGGGLFLKDTNPNSLSGWQWSCSIEMLEKIKVPIVVLAVGYNRFRGQDDFDPIFKYHINKIIEKSIFFGLRNSGSINAVKNYICNHSIKNKVKFHPCPTTIISKIYTIPKYEGQSFIAVNIAFDRSDKRYGKDIEKVMNNIVSVIKQLSKDYKIKYYIHVQTDDNFLPYMETSGIDFEIVYLNGERNINYFIDNYSSPELVIGTRGHAQMIPFGCQTPILSIISHDKMQWFLDDIKHLEWGVDINDNDFENKLLNTAKIILKNKDRIKSEIIDAQEELWYTTCKNIEYLMERLNI